MVLNPNFPARRVGPKVGQRIRAHERTCGQTWCALYGKTIQIVSRLEILSNGGYHGVMNERVA